MGKKLFHFFIFSNLFIATCAGLMVFQTCMLLLEKNPEPHFLLFVLSGTICSYSFHWWLTPVSTSFSPRLNWLLLYRRVHFLFFFVGLAGVIYSGYYLLPHWRWLLLGAVTTFFYSAPKIPHRWFRILRRVAVGKTVFLSLSWTYVTTLLPLLMSREEWRMDFTLFAVSRYFLIYAICILFDYRDREYDRSIGIRSLITWLSEKNIALLFISSLFIFAAASIAMLAYGHTQWQVISLLIPGIIVAALYRTAIRHSGDLFYYFVLDGLMALSALLMIIGGN